MHSLRACAHALQVAGSQLEQLLCKASFVSVLTPLKTDGLTLG